MRRQIGIAAVAVLATAALPLAALAETITFKLLPRYSYATFKTDAPLETVVGHTADAGLQGDLAVDPAKPQGESYLDTETEANRWVTFTVQSVEVAGPRESGKVTPAKIRGLLTVKQKPVERVSDGTVTYIKLSPEQVEAQKRFGFTSDNIKVRTKLATTFTDHAMQIPQLLVLKLSNDIAIETDLTFIRQ